MQFFYSLNVKHVILCGQRKKCVPKKYFLTCSCRFLHHNYLFKFEFFQCIYTGEASSKNCKKHSISKIVLTFHFSNKWSLVISRIFQILGPQPQIYISFSQWLVNFFSHSRSEQFLKQNIKIYLSSMSINYHKPHFFTQLRMPSLQIAFFFSHVFAKFIWFLHATHLLKAIKLRKRKCQT